MKPSTLTPESDTQSRVINLISWILRVPSSKIYPHTRLRDDLALDAFDVALLIANLENRFNVYLTPEEVEAIETVQDASFYLTRPAA